MSDFAVSLETYVQIRHFYSIHTSIRNLKLFLTVLLSIGLFLSALQLGTCFESTSGSLQDYINESDRQHVVDGHTHNYLIHKSAEITEQILLLCCMLVGIFAVLLESRSGVIVFCLFDLATIIYTTCLPLTDHFWQIVIYQLILGCLGLWLFYLLTKRRSGYVVMS